eukprot:gene11651-4890_t
MRQLFVFTVFVLICLVLSETKLNGFAPMDIKKAASAPVTVKSAQPKQVGEKVLKKTESVKSESKPTTEKKGQEGSWNNGNVSKNFGATTEQVKKLEVKSEESKKQEAKPEAKQEEVKKTEEVKPESKPTSEKKKQSGSWNNGNSGINFGATQSAKKEETGSEVLEDPLKVTLKSYFPLSNGVHVSEIDSNVESTEKAEDYEHTLAASLNYENSLEVDSPEVVLGDSYESATVKDYENFLSAQKHETVTLSGKALKTDIDDTLE